MKKVFEIETTHASKPSISLHLSQLNPLKFIFSA